MPGTNRWKPVRASDDKSGSADSEEEDDPSVEAEEEVVQDEGMVGREETPGVLIVRVRDDLDFGSSPFFHLFLFLFFSSDQIFNI